MPPVTLTIGQKGLWSSPLQAAETPSPASPRQPVLLPGQEAYHFLQQQAHFTGLTNLPCDLERAPHSHVWASVSLSVA